LTSSDQFYKREKEREEGELANAGVSEFIGDDLAKPQNDSLIIRVDRRSGAESMTIERHRNNHAFSFLKDRI
jgi:hypothetical protein